MTAFTLGLLMLAAFALAARGIYLWSTGGERKQAVLTLVAAAVFLANVLIVAL